MWATTANSVAVAEKHEQAVPMLVSATTGERFGRWIAKRMTGKTG